MYKGTRKIIVDKASSIGYSGTINRKENMNKKDPFGFDKAINYDKLNDPKVLEQLEEIFNKEEKDESSQKEE